MGKNITIQQGGTDQTFQGVTHIKIPSVEGGDTDWVPAESGSNEVKQIDENGTYSAASDSVDGWKVIFVNVPPTQVTGEDPDDGQQYTYMVDMNGNLIKVPAS